MAGADCAFFYTARSVGINRTVVSLATHPQLDWRGRQAVLVAEAEQEALRLYGMDMLWMLVRTKYEGEFPQPSKLVKHETKPKGPQTKKEIINYILGRLQETEERIAQKNRMDGDEINGSYDPGSPCDA